jgi:hypothetical protein
MKIEVTGQIVLKISQYIISEKRFLWFLSYGHDDVRMDSAICIDCLLMCE